MPTNMTRNFFQAIKTVYGPSRRKLCPIEDNNGNLIKEEEGIRSRWREHYSNILNHETTANHDILQVIPQYPVSMTWTARCRLSKSRQLSTNLKITSLRAAMGFLQKYLRR